MKFLFAILILFTAGLVHADDDAAAEAAAQAAKLRPCNAFYETVARDGSVEDRLKSALDAINVCYDLKLSDADYAQLRTNLLKMWDEGSSTQDNFERAAVFGCQEMLTMEDRVIAQETIKKLLEPQSL